MLEHTRAIKNKNAQYPVARHFETTHNSNPNLLSFFVVDSILLSRRGGDREQNLRKMESRYIIDFETQAPNGQNRDEELSVHLDE